MFVVANETGERKAKQQETVSQREPLREYVTFGPLPRAIMREVIIDPDPDFPCSQDIGIATSFVTLL